MKKVHYFTGLFLSLFVIIHLFNHLLALAGPDTHIAWMEVFRKIYRNRVGEVLLLAACIVQTVAGYKLLSKKWKYLHNNYDRFHVYSGIVLSVFLTLHPTAILVGRYYFGADTNFWFAAMTVNVFPLLIAFIPYYFLGALSFFVHVACIYRLTIMKKVGKAAANRQANIIMVFGVIIALMIMAGLTGNFQGLEIPEEYLRLVS